MLKRLAFALAMVAGHVPGATAQGVTEVRTGFEDAIIPPEFVICHRPENEVVISDDRARHGERSLELSIHEIPMFPKEPPLAAVRWSPSPVSCLLADKLALYRSDEAERAELWESKDTAPAFGQEAWYGFSMWIDADSVPYGDANRVVLGQWKANYRPDSRASYSPFLSQRFTGGFYHITLDVDARQPTGDDGEPKTCRLLLAFAGVPPSPLEPRLDLARPAACEMRLQYEGFALVPVEPVRIERHRYLPNPFGRWTDLIFRVKGGEDGIVQVWANGALIATARGWIGHKEAVGSGQYFKFGPYRDPASYGFSVYLDNLARGNSKEFVDSSRH